MVSSDKNFAIIGAGLTGLSAAYFLKKRFPTGLRITVLESAERCGGWVRSIRHKDGAVYELGPRSVRFRSPTAPYILRLVEDLELQSSIIPVHAKAPAATNRFIYCKGQLNQLNLFSLTTQPPFTKPFYPILLNTLMSIPSDESDMSVDYFFRSRFSDEIADYLVNPFMRGIYAGDSKKLGISAVLPDLVRYEKMSGNAVLGYLVDSAKKSLYAPPKLPFKSDLYNCAKSNNWLLWSLKGGMETLINRLEEKLVSLGVNIFTNSYVPKITVAENGKIDIRHSAGLHIVDHCLLTTSAKVSENILTTPNPKFEQLSKFLKLFSTVSVAVVVMEFEGTLRPVNGFGHLIPSSEIPHVLGVIYDSCIFPQMDCHSRPSTRFSCMIGGAWFHEYCSQMKYEDFEQLAIESVQKQLGITSTPFRTFVSVHHNCITQYGIDHRKLVDHCRNSIHEMRLPISLLGASYDGVSVSDCVASAYNNTVNLSL